MKKICGLAAVAVLIFFVPPKAALATGVKTLTGNVISASGGVVVFANGSAAKYLAVVNNAVLVRKNGAVMIFSEILPNDKIEVKGTLWPDNSINANVVRNLSLYTHSGSFSGKVTEINSANSSFTLQSTKYGNQKIRTDSLTIFKKNKSISTFKDIELGMGILVKGAWDRTTSDVLAREAAGTLRFINIDVTGTLSMKGDSSLTIIGNGNVIYGVDITNAKLQNKNGKTLNLANFGMDDIIRVKGKHVSGSVKIVGITVKDLSVLK